MTQQPITVARVGPRETENICDLLSRVFPNNPKADPAILRWQYWNGPFGRAVCCVQRAGDEVVGHVARVPVPIVVDGHTVSGCVTVDAATDPRFRNLGLYGALRIFCNAEASQEGMEVGIDFRASRTRLPTGAAPWAGRLTRYVIPLQPRWVADRLRLPRTLARGLVRLARPRPSAGSASSEVPDGIQELWEAVAPGISFGVEKNEAWWRWRYGDHPTRPYTYHVIRDGGTLSAVAVTRYRADQDVLAVLDLLAQTPDSGAELIGAIARSSDAGALAFITGKWSPWARLARAGGFRSIPFDRERQSVYIRDLSGRRPNLTDQRWAVTWGDMDHV